MQEIAITHYVNPYKIYYKHLPTPDEKIGNLEQAIEEQIKPRNDIDYPVFQVAELVFVNYLPYKRGIRGMVLEVLHNFNRLKPDYIIWSLDYGFPIRTEGAFVQPLPKRFSKPIEGLHIVHAGLRNIIPLKETNKLDWDDETCVKVLDVLSQDGQLFLEKEEPGDAIKWVSLEIKTLNGDTWNVNELLGSYQIVKTVDESEFKNLIIQHNLPVENPVFIFGNGLTNYHLNESDLTQSEFQFDTNTITSETNPTLDNETTQPAVSNELADNLVISQEEAMKIKSAKSTIQMCFIHPSTSPSDLLSDVRNDIQLEIPEVLGQMGFTENDVLQSYSWPHLQKDDSLFIVSPQGSGKNFCFLPYLLEMVNKDDLLHNTDTYGPIAIIVTPSILHTNKITDQFGELLDHLEPKSMEKLIHTEQDSEIVWSKPFGIYVTTLNDFLNIITMEKIDKNRLKTIVIYKIDRFLNSNKSVTEISKTILLNYLESFGCQFVVTASEWRPYFMDLQKKIPNNPVLLMSNFLEAAIYNGCSFIIKIIESVEEKLNYLWNYLENREALGEVKHLVVVCNKITEAEFISNSLHGLGISIFLYTDDHEEIDNSRLTNTIANGILIGTDAMISKLQLTSMQTLIHYSLPSSSWTLFTARFALLCNQSSILSRMPPSPLNYPPTDKKSETIILLNTTDTEFLKTFEKFSQKHKLCKKTLQLELLKILENSMHHDY